MGVTLFAPRLSAGAIPGPDVNRLENLNTQIRCQHIKHFDLLAAPFGYIE
jgi:hypothetical protein